MPEMRANLAPINIPTSERDRPDANRMLAPDQGGTDPRLALPPLSALNQLKAKRFYILLGLRLFRALFEHLVDQTKILGL